MVTGSRFFRRHPTRVLASFVAALLLAAVASPSAHADQIATLKAQAAAIASKISTLGIQEEVLSETYDRTRSQLDALEAKLAQAKSALAGAQASAAQARSALAADAIQAYVDGGTNPLSASTPSNTQAIALLRSEYASTLATDQSEAIDRYKTASLEEQTASTKLANQTSAVAAQVSLLATQRNSLVSTSDQLTAIQAQVSGQLAAAVARQQAAAFAAAAAAQQAAAARQLAASTPAQFSVAAGGAAGVAQSGQTTGFQPQGAPTAYTPPPQSSAAGRAVAAAESRLGDWYQWAAAGPTTFDCSGLVMWAYAQAGISLPHYSGAQYADTIHNPRSALQPGDLVFFANPGEHVAMYVGGGDIIEAPYTGAQVHIVAMYSGFVLAGRVA